MTQDFLYTTWEDREFREAMRLYYYYKGDFAYEYRGVSLPANRTLENTLVTDNVIARTVNRFASSTVGKTADVEVDNEELDALLDEWYERIDFNGKINMIARYQSLYGSAVIKLVFNFPDNWYDDDRNIVITGKTPQDILNHIDIGVFGGKDCTLRFDAFNNVESIAIRPVNELGFGQYMEIFYKDKIEHLKGSGMSYQIQSTEINPFPNPLAFAVRNLETGIHSKSDIRDIISLQEDLNTALTAHRLALESHGFPIYFATGIELEQDADGNPKPLILGPGMTLASDKDTTKFGRIDVPNLSPLTEGIAVIERKLASATYSLALLQGNIPSGLALSYLTNDFNSLIAEKQGKIRRFIYSLHKSLFSILDTCLNTAYGECKMVITLSGNNVLQEASNMEQATQAYSLGALSLESYLNTMPFLSGATADEVARIEQEKAALPHSNLLSAVGG